MARVAFFLFLLMLPLVAASQPVGRGGDDWGWVTMGVGPGHPHGTAVMATANLGRTRFVQLGLHTSGEFNPFSAGPVLTSHHISGGLSRVSRWSRAAVSVGPALVYERDFAGYDRRALDSRRALGVLVNGQATFTPSAERGFGIGINVYAHTSALRNGYGAGLTFVFEGDR